jgi:hypothetical protein
MVLEECILELRHFSTANLLKQRVLYSMDFEINVGKTIFR